MVSRRSNPTVPTEQSVRMYKFIALAFLLLTLILFGIVVFMSSKRADIIITSNIAPIDVTTSLEFGSGQQQNHQISHIVTSTTIILEETVTPTGSKEEPGIATGFVTLHNESNADQPLVATTRLLSESGVLFRLKHAVRVPANGTLENVEVYADKEGKQGDIEASKFSIPGLNEAKQKVIYAVSENLMKGGVAFRGIVSEDDIEKASKKLASQAQMQAAEILEKAHPEYAGVYHVSTVEIESEVEIGEEATSFPVKATATVVGVLYDDEHLQRWAAGQLAKRAIGDTESIRPSDTAPTVTFASYDEGKGVAVVNVFYDGKVTISPQSKQIQKEMFFGKTEEEVRRYVLSLDHVHKVDIEFYPAWMQTVPHIHDHVSVIVKEVE